MHYCRRDSHATSRTPIYTISRKLVVLGYILAGFGSFWLVLLVLWVVLAGFVGDFGWFWVVLGGFGWFCVLVTTVA